MTRLAEIMRLLYAPCPFCVGNPFCTTVGQMCTMQCLALNRAALVKEAREIRERQALLDPAPAMLAGLAALRRERQDAPG